MVVMGKFLECVNKTQILFGSNTYMLFTISLAPDKVPWPGKSFCGRMSHSMSPSPLIQAQGLSDPCSYKAHTAGISPRYLGTRSVGGGGGESVFVEVGED